MSVLSFNDVVLSVRLSPNSVQLFIHSFTQQHQFAGSRETSQPNSSKTNKTFVFEKLIFQDEEANKQLAIHLEARKQRWDLFYKTLLSVGGNRFLRG